MSKKYEPELMLELKPSRRLRQMIVFANLLALGACIMNTLPVTVKFSLLTGICIHLWFVIHCLKIERYKIRHTEALGWEIAADNGFKSVTLLKSTVITIFAIWLHIKRQNADKQAILVLNDALCKDDYRRLIVKLKTSLTQ
ncbi:MAG: protein YgfX [Methylobacter sp.]